MVPTLPDTGPQSPRVQQLRKLGLRIPPRWKLLPFVVLFPSGSGLLVLFVVSVVFSVLLILSMVLFGVGVLSQEYLVRQIYTT